MNDASGISRKLVFWLVCVWLIMAPTMARDVLPGATSAAARARVAILTPAGTAEIHGAKWHDLNTDGTWDSVEPSLPGWVIYLDMNKNGHRDFVEPWAKTDDRGEYAFVGLDKDSYLIREELQDGWGQTYPSSGEYAINLGSGEIVDGVDFGNYRLPDAWDFGDAPQPPYPTVAAENGAVHLIKAGMYLGSQIDADADGQPDADATGDDLDGNDDEDGVVLTSSVQRGSTATVDVTASVQGYLNAWVDFDGGGWDGPADQIFTDTALSPGVNHLSFPVPDDATLGQTFARFRFSSVAGLSWDGEASDGEVEDMAITIDPLHKYDFGDAPDSPYPTSKSSGGAYHTILPGFYLGGDVDGEEDGQPSADAGGDDKVRLDDEDGVTFTSLLVPDRTATVDVVASENGILNAWIDFDGDGSWSGGDEHIFDNRSLVAGINSLSFPVPAGATLGETYARFRFNKNGELMPTGGATEGEVEDYRVEIVRVDWGDAPDVDEGPYWTQLMPSTPEAWDRFGETDVDISGNWIIVGAYGDGPGVYGAGAAYMFRWDGVNWVEEQKLTASDGEEDEVFGDAVSVSGDWVAVAAPWDDEGGVKSGSVYLYWWDGAAWSEKEKHYGSRLDQFGEDVDLDGSWMIVGASWARTEYVPAGTVNFYRESGGSWTKTDEVAPWDGAHDDYFGAAVALDGDWAIVGAPQDDHDGMEDAGSAYMIHWDGASWTEVQKLTASDGAADDLFGSDVAISGDWAIVGMGRYDDAVPGAAYVFHRDGSTWTETQKLTPSSPDPNDHFGKRVAIDGEWATVSATSRDTPHQNAGAVYIFHLEGATWQEALTISIPDPNVKRLGESLALEGRRAVAGASIDWTGGYDAAYVLEWAVDANNYPTLAASDGARHTIASGLYLGDKIDAEPDGQPDPPAEGDDDYPSGGPDDEDGVVFAAPLNPGTTAQVNVTASAAGKLDAWLDFNKDGDWDDEEEQICASQDLVAGLNVLNFSVPETALPSDQEDPSYARFRFSSTGGLSTSGLADDGEVEDHKVEVLAAPKPPVVSIAITGLNDEDVKLSWPHVTEDVSGNPITVVEYWVYRLDEPYFEPDNSSNRVAVLAGPFAATVVWIDTGKIGDTATNYFYYVKAVADVGGVDVASARSNHVGEFDFGLVPGD